MAAEMVDLEPISICAATRTVLSKIDLKLTCVLFELVTMHQSSVKQSSSLSCFIVFLFFFYC